VTSELLTRSDPYTSRLETFVTIYSNIYNKVI